MKLAKQFTLSFVFMTFIIVLNGGSYASEDVMISQVRNAGSITDSTDNGVGQATQQKARELLLEGRKQYAADNLFEAMPLIEQASDLGLPEAQGFYAYILYQAGFYEKAIVLFESAAQQDDEFSKLKLGEFYLFARHVDLDVSKGLKLLSECVEKKYTPAMLVLGQLYAAGDKSIPKNEAKALTLFQQAAELMDVNAITMMENIYNQGLLGQSIDPIKVQYWSQKRSSIPSTNTEKQ